VFANAIALLVLHVRIPESEFDLWAGIVAAWPANFGYVTSFLTSGGVWLVHHEPFERLRHVEATFMRVNLLLLALSSCRSPRA